MSEDSIKNSKSFFSEWLEKLQQESWQLELIISGFVLYGIYNSRGAILDIAIGIELTDSINLSTVKGFMLIFYWLLANGWKIFFINLILHVILRSLWIGAIGLRYVSGDIDYTQLNYSDTFTGYLSRRIGSYDDFIEKLERICSVIFSYTFLLFLFFLSILLFVFFALLPMTISTTLFPDNDLLDIFLIFFELIYIFLGLIVFIDFLSMGGIKRIKDDTISKIYLPIYRFFSTITLSFLYRPLLYNFIDSKYTRKLFFISFPYMMIIISWSNLFENNLYPHFDRSDDLMKEGLIVHDSRYFDLMGERIKNMEAYERKAYLLNNRSEVMISNYQLHDSKLSFFVRMYNSDELLLKEKYKIPTILKSGLRFSLFSGNKEKDEEKDSFNENYLDKYRLMRKRYNSYRDSINLIHENKKAEEFLTNYKDSVSTLVSNFEAERKEKDRDYGLNRNKRILETLQKHIEVKIDSIDLTDSLKCHFFLSPYFGDKGLLCNLSNTKFSEGNHQIKIKRGFYVDSAKDSMRIFKYNIPFMNYNQN